MAELHTLDGDKLADVTTVTFNDARTKVGFVVVDPGTLTVHDETTSYLLHTDDGDTVKVLPFSGEGDTRKQRWACYVK